MIKERIHNFIYNKILSYPSSIILQTVSSCNLKCKHCFFSQFGKEIPDGKTGLLDYKDFVFRANKISSFIKHASFFHFSGFEALLHKDLFKMMEFILSVNPYIKFPIYTNGNSFKEDTIKNLSRFPVPEVVVSLDGIKKETVENFKTGSNFEKTISTIKNLKSALRKSEIKTVFVLHKNNVFEFPNYIDFVNSLGIKTIFVTNLLCFSKEMTGLAVYNGNNLLDIQKIINKGIQRAKKNKQIIYLPLLKPIPLGCTQCLSLFIDIKGNVCPCDYLSVKTSFYFNEKENHPEPVIFGNILKDDIKKIWFSKNFSHFRSLHKKGKIPSVCNCCIDAYGMLCSKRKIYK